MPIIRQSMILSCIISATSIYNIVTIAEFTISMIFNNIPLKALKTEEF